LYVVAMVIQLPVDREWYYLPSVLSLMGIMLYPLSPWEHFFYCSNGIILPYPILDQGPSWTWSYGSWIYNYLCNWCLSPLMLWVRIPLRKRCTTLF